MKSPNATTAILSSALLFVFSPNNASSLISPSRPAVRSTLTFLSASTDNLDDLPQTAHLSSPGVVTDEILFPSTDNLDDPSQPAQPSSPGVVKDEILQLKNSFLLSAASTDRGQLSSPAEKLSLLTSCIETLELRNPTPKPAYSEGLIYGTWELVYCDTQLFRSSPFFMAGRAVCETEEQAKQYDWFCDMHRGALAISRIGKVKQIVSPTRLVSEFEVIVGAVPFLSDFTPFSYSGGLPFTITGSIVSSSDITPVNDGDAFEIFMDSVEIKGSNIPLIREILDAGLKLPSRGLGGFLEENVPGYTNPKPIFRTTFLDDDTRISRDQDDHVFVYRKVSNEEMETDYGDVPSDLGLGDLFKGLGDVFLSS